MTNIQTMAYKLQSPKLKKHEAQAIVEKLYVQGLTNIEIVQLYKFFAPVMPKKAKTLEQWVYKARSNGQTRPFLHHSYSDGQNLVAVDGHRMHIIPTTLPVGFYDADCNPMDIVAVFPDYKRIIPKTNTTTQLNTNDFECGSQGNDQLFKICGQWFNQTYVNNMLNGESTVTLSYDDNNSQGPMMFTFDDRKAVLMPVRKRE